MNSNTPGGAVVENKFASLLWEIGSHYSRLLGFKLYFFFDLVTLRVINLIGCGGILPKTQSQGSEANGDNDDLFSNFARCE